MNKIIKNIKALAVKTVGAYSLIQLDAKENRDRKRKDREREKEWRESFCCPHCNYRHTESQYYRNQTKKEDVKAKLEHGTVYFNFLECLKCGELFGVEETHYYGGLSLGTVRSPFKLKDK